MKQKDPVAGAYYPRNSLQSIDFPRKAADRPKRGAAALGREADRGEDRYRDEGEEGRDEDEGARGLRVAAVGLCEDGRVSRHRHGREDDGEGEEEALEPQDAQDAGEDEGEEDEAVQRGRV